MEILIHVAQSGNIGNKMIQFMAALSLAARIPKSTISGIDLPEWGIFHPRVPTRPSTKTLVLSDVRRMHIDIDTVANGVLSGKYDQIVMNLYAQDIRNFLPVEYYKAIFKSSISVQGCDDSEIIINIRGGEVFSGKNRHYVTLPINYYKEIIAKTRLRPVFMGQLDKNAYITQLMNAFPNAQFVPSQGILHDFEMIRRSRNVVISVSTFSWLAAWLSDAEQIFMPLSGIFNPCQFPEIDLSPRLDKRFRYFLFPINYNMPVEEVERGHKAIDGLWREISPFMLEQIRLTRPRFLIDNEKMFGSFDEKYYLETFPHLMRALAVGGIRSGLEHYRGVGIKQGMEPFALDRVWYFCSYPLAAFEVGQGDFLDFHHHYVGIGKARGYVSVPPA